MPTSAAFTPPSYSIDIAKELIDKSIFPQCASLLQSGLFGEEIGDVTVSTEESGY